MRFFSVSTCRVLVHWQVLLLTVSLLNFWSLATVVQPRIFLFNTEEGSDVTLYITNVSLKIEGITWYRGKGDNEHRTIAFFRENSKMRVRSPSRGRVEMYFNGSLEIKNVTKNDRGWYTLVIHCKNSIVYTEWVQLTVYDAVTVPSLVSRNATVTENKDAVVLTCYTNVESTKWMFNGMDLQLSERMKLSKDCRTLSINPVRREDAGYYQCVVSNQFYFAESMPVWLNVNYE